MTSLNLNIGNKRNLWQVKQSSETRSDTQIRAQPVFPHPIMADEADGHCAGRKWGFVAYNVADAPKCISRCRQRFIDSLEIDNNLEPRGQHHETFAAVCKVLSDKTPQRGGRKDQPFWDLYCCDAQSCGINSVEVLGEDRKFSFFYFRWPFLNAYTPSSLRRKGGLVKVAADTYNAANINWIINTCAK